MLDHASLERVLRPGTHLSVEIGASLAGVKDQRQLNCTTAEHCNRRSEETRRPLLGFNGPKRVHDGRQSVDLRV